MADAESPGSGYRGFSLLNRAFYWLVRDYLWAVVVVWRGFSGPPVLAIAVSSME